MDNAKEKELFWEALENASPELMRNVPKSDLHNHVGRGGSQAYLAAYKGVTIKPSTTYFDTLQDMQNWFENNIKIYYPGLDGYLDRVKASFIQAKDDSIKVLSMSYGLDEIVQLGGMDNFIHIMTNYQKLAPNTNFYPELVLFRHSDIGQDSENLEQILDYNYFKSVDWQGNENTRNIADIIPMFRIAKSHHLVLRAHVGEFGNAQCVQGCVEKLELNEIHHGINVVEDKSLMKYLADNSIPCNVCPTSNIMLKRSASYKNHQIRKLFDTGVKVTINSDDLSIFNSSVSQEFLNLYKAQVFNKEELECIRQQGLGYRKNFA
jgi:adenosine deaminase